MEALKLPLNFEMATRALQQIALRHKYMRLLCLKNERTTEGGLEERA